jgi:hypothetical protein
VARPVQDELTACTRKERQNNRHPIAHIVLELLQRCIVELQHRRVQSDNALLGNFTRSGCQYGSPREGILDDRVH